MSLVRAVLVLVGLSCSRPPQLIDIMRQPPICDLPAPVLSTPVAQFPSDVRSDPEYATLIGFVADSVGRVLGQGQVLLDPQPGQILPRQFAITDSAGAYVLRQIVEGEHRVLFRAIGYVAEHRTIHVQKGDVLAVPMRLRFYRCHGY
jgi:hypothetical protein